jgi:hypothetical protein
MALEFGVDAARGEEVAEKRREEVVCWWWMMVVVVMVEVEEVWVCFGGWAVC